MEFSDIDTESPDKKSILMYIICLFQSLSHEIKNINSLKSSPGSRPVSVALGKYQSDLEEVLTWLLEAEEKLNFTFDENTSLAAARNYFKEYYEFLDEIKSRRIEILDVLLEGSTLANLGGLSREEANEVQLQVSLLESRWKQLTLGAMNHQSYALQYLMKTQNDELKKFKAWLNDVELRITKLTTQPGPLVERLQQSLALQEEIQGHEDTAESLKKLIVVEDDAFFESSKK